MKTTLTLAALGTAALLMTGVAAEAQARFSDIDRNGDGRLSYAELEAEFGRAAAGRLWRGGGEQELTRADVRRMAGGDDRDDERGGDRDDARDDDRDDDDDDNRDEDGRDDDDRDDDGRDDDDGGDDGDDDDDDD